MLQVVEAQLCVAPLGVAEVPLLYPQPGSWGAPWAGFAGRALWDQQLSLEGSRISQCPISLDHIQLSGSAVLPGAAGGAGNEHPPGTASAAGAGCAPLEGF